MELTIFELGCEIDELFLKEGRDDKKCVKWGKRLASTNILLMKIKPSGFPSSHLLDPRPQYSIIEGCSQIVFKDIE